MPKLHDKPMHFIPGSAQPARDKTHWRGAAPAETTRCNGEACMVALPKSSDRGCFMIVCEDYPAWALVSVQASVSDPRNFTMPCGRIRMAVERLEDRHA